MSGPGVLSPTDIPAAQSLPTWQSLGMGELLSKEGGAEGAASSGFAGIMARVRARKWTQTLRPIAGFVAPSRFTRPRSTQEATQRLEANMQYFLTNYVLVCFLIFSYAILSRPLLLLVGGLLSAMWYYVLRAPEVRVTASIVLKGKQKITAAAITSVVAVLVFAGTTIFMVVGVCASVVVMHALFHMAPTAQDEMASEPGSGVEMSPV